MNLKKGKFKIVEGTRVRMVSSKDTFPAADGKQIADLVKSCVV